MGFRNPYFAYHVTYINEMLSPVHKNTLQKTKTTMLLFLVNIQI